MITGEVLKPGECVQTPLEWIRIRSGLYELVDEPRVRIERVTSTAWQFIINGESRLGFSSALKHVAHFPVGRCSWCGNLDVINGTYLTCDDCQQERNELTRAYRRGEAAVAHVERAWRFAAKVRKMNQREAFDRLMPLVPAPTMKRKKVRARKGTQ